jgi:hypothetical protein
MAQNNILDPHFVDIFPHMPPEQQRQGVDILKVECTKIEDAGSMDAQLAMMGQSDAASLPEDERKAIVAAGLDQCYWQLTKFLREQLLASYHPSHPKHSLLVFNPFTNRRSSTLYKEGSCSLRD